MLIVSLGVSEQAKPVLTLRGADGGRRCSPRCSGSSCRFYAIARVATTTSEPACVIMKVSRRKENRQQLWWQKDANNLMCRSARTKRNNLPKHPARSTLESSASPSSRAFLTLLMVPRCSLSSTSVALATSLALSATCSALIAVLRISCSSFAAAASSAGSLRDIRLICCIWRCFGPPLLPKREVANVQMSANLASFVSSTHARRKAEQKRNTAPAVRRFAGKQRVRMKKAAGARSRDGGIFAYSPLSTNKFATLRAASMHRAAASFAQLCGHSVVALLEGEPSPSIWVA